MGNITKDDLIKIRHADFEDNTYEGGIYRAIQKIIGDKTDNFTNPDGLSSKQEDMTEDIENAGKSVADYKKKFGTTKRSEVDVALHLIDVIDGKEFTPPPAETYDSSDDDSTDDSDEEFDDDFEFEMEMELELQKQRAKMIENQNKK